MPAAIGCSERLSSAAASRRMSASLRPSKEITSVTPNRPSVSVPVLSKTTASSARARSKAARSRISSPFRAGTGDAQRDRRFPVYCSTQHRVSAILLHGLRLAREQCLIDGRPAFGDLAVRGNPLAWFNQHQVILPKLRDRDVLRRSVGAQAVRLGWQQSNQLLESPRSAQYRAHL